MKFSFAILLLTAIFANSLASVQKSLSGVIDLYSPHDDGQKISAFEESLHSPSDVNEFQLGGERLGISKSKSKPCLGNELNEGVAWMRKRRSLAALSSTLMGVSKIADNPPGAEEQRQFERRQQQENEQQRRPQKMREQQKAGYYEQQPQQQQHQQQQQQPQYGGMYDPSEDQRNLVKQSQLWNPWEEQIQQEQEQYVQKVPLQQTEIGTEEEEEDLKSVQQVPQNRVEMTPRYIYEQEEDPYVQPKQYEQPPAALQNQEYEQLYQPLYARYVREQSEHQRSRRSFLGGMGLDFIKNIGLQDSISGMSDAQIRKDISRSRYDPVTDQQDLMGYHKQLFQPNVDPSDLENTQTASDYGMASVKCACNKQQPTSQPQNILYEPKYPEYTNFQKQMDGPSAGRAIHMKAPSKTLSQPPVSSYHVKVPSYLDSLPNDMRGMFSKEDYLPTEHISKSPYQPSSQKGYGQDFAQDIVNDIAPAAGPMQKQKQPFGLSDPFDIDFNKMPSSQHLQTGVPEPFPVLDESLTDPQKSLGRKHQLGSPSQKLQYMGGM